MKRRSLPVVAIDGPAGAGKTTVTRRVAHELGYLLVDTGALYRAVALAARLTSVSWDDPERLSELALDLAQRGAIRFSSTSSGQRILLHDEDVSEQIRTQRMGEGASKVSAVAGVRAALLEMQRSAGEAGGVVLEGRDIGTVVFPDAEAKFYLTASVEIRAQRRYEELVARGNRPALDEVRREVLERDRRDSTRPVAPLRQAGDAIVVDSSSLSIDEVVAMLVSHVRKVEQELAADAERGGERA
jgi:cytidylate kinase